MPETLTDPFSVENLQSAVPVVPARKSALANVTVKEETDLEVVAQAPAPFFIRRIQEDRKAGITHTFLVAGNISDYVDTTGSGAEIRMLLTFRFDTVWSNKQMEARYQNLGKKWKAPISPADQVFAYYSIPDGLVFPDPDSKKLWVNQIEEAFKDQPALAKAALNHGKELPSVLSALNISFLASKTLAERRKTEASGRKPLVFTVAFQDADILFPQQSGPMGAAGVTAIGHIRSWARDAAIGDRNTILLLAKQSTDIHESIRGGDSGVSVIEVKKPSRVEREQWLTNFSTVIDKSPRILGGERRSKINYADGMDHRLFAINAAGMNLKQMEQVILNSWRSGEPVNLQAVMTRKKAAIQEEYGGLIEFFDPSVGFDQVGGHDNLKRYAIEKCVEPMLLGDLASVSKGFLITGPPGTGKTAFSKALAFEAKMNFIILNLNRLMGNGLLGQAETLLNRAIEAIRASAPCLVFVDELDMQASNRDANAGGGANDHQLNAIMELLADDSRRGKIVILSATNRPDRLEAALIRSGRFDAILPGLPPGPGDTQGRMLVMQALSKKHNVAWSEDVRPTKQNVLNGYGKLLRDEKVWTGAEIEVVMLDAIDNAKRRLRKATLADVLMTKEEKQEVIRVFSARPVISLEDWDAAFESVVPSTGDVEFQTNLALLFCNKQQYIPDVWKEMVKDRAKLEESVQAHLLQGGLSREV